jgi:hypothetical protein
MLFARTLLPSGQISLCLLWLDLRLQLRICYDMLIFCLKGRAVELYDRRSAPWRALTRPIAAIMVSLFRPVVSSRSKS